MTEEEPATRDSRTTWIVVLAVVVTVLVGAIIGYIASGGLSDDPAVETTSTTTPLATPTTSPSVATSVPVTAATSTQPVSTDPPGQLTVIASEDTFTDASDASEINGFDALIELEEDAPDVKRGLVRFDLVGLPEGVTIESAEIRLSTASPSAAPIAVHLVDGEWNETETAAATAPVPGERVTTIPAGGDQGEPLVGDVTGAMTGPGQISFYLISTTENTTEIFSRENGANGPALVVRWAE